MSDEPSGVDVVLARAAGDRQDWVDADTARRIAAGAAAATAAVELARRSVPAIAATGTDATPDAAVEAARALLSVLESLARTTE